MELSSKISPKPTKIDSDWLLYLDFLYLLKYSLPTINHIFKMTNLHQTLNNFCSMRCASLQKFIFDKCHRRWRKKSIKIIELGFIVSQCPNPTRCATIPLPSILLLIYNFTVNGLSSLRLTAYFVLHRSNHSTISKICLEYRTTISEPAEPNAKSTAKNQIHNIGICDAFGRVNVEKRQNLYGWRSKRDQTQKQLRTKRRQHFICCWQTYLRGI